MTWIIGRVRGAADEPAAGGRVYHHRQARRSRRRCAHCARSSRGRRFDVLLHMQLSLRASLLSTLVPATRAPGIRSRARARAAVAVHQCAHRAAPRSARARQLPGFPRWRSASTARPPEWHLPLPTEARQYAAALVPDAQPTLIISPCSSHSGAQLACRALCRDRRARGARPRHARDPVRRVPRGSSATMGEQIERAAARASDQSDRTRHAAAAAGAAGSFDRAAVPRTPARRTWRPWSVRR